VLREAEERARCLYVFLILMFVLTHRGSLFCVICQLCARYFWFAFILEFSSFIYYKVDVLIPYSMHIPLNWYFYFILFTCESSYCFQRVLAIAILTVCPSVRLSITRVDQSKTVQDRITKSSPSAAWKTLVSGTIKLFHKFEGGHLERGP